MFASGLAAAVGVARRNVFDPMKVAFVSTYDATDVRQWSGVPAHMFGALAARGPVQRIGPLKNTAALPSMAKRVAYMAAKRRYHRDRDATLLRSYARQVERQLARDDSDVVLSPG